MDGKMRETVIFIINSQEGWRVRQKTEMILGQEIPGLEGEIGELEQAVERVVIGEVLGNLAQVKNHTIQQVEITKEEVAALALEMIAEITVAQETLAEEKIGGQHLKTKYLIYRVEKLSKDMKLTMLVAK